MPAECRFIHPARNRRAAIGGDQLAYRILLGVIFRRHFKFAGRYILPTGIGQVGGFRAHHIQCERPLLTLELHFRRQQVILHRHVFLVIDIPAAFLDAVYTVQVFLVHHRIGGGRQPPQPVGQIAGTNMRLKMLGHFHGLRPADHIHGFTVRLVDVAMNDDFGFAHRFLHENGQGVLLADLPEGKMALADGTVSTQGKAPFHFPLAHVFRRFRHEVGCLERRAPL